MKKLAHLGFSLHFFLWNRWGPQLEQATYKNRQRLYLSEQVSLFLRTNTLFLLMGSFLCLFYLFIYLFMLCYQTDGSVPNTLVIANCEVVKPRVAAAEHISQVLAFSLFRFHFLFVRLPSSCFYGHLLCCCFSLMKRRDLRLSRSTRPLYILERYGCDGE